MLAFPLLLVQFSLGQDSFDELLDDVLGAIVKSIDLGEDLEKSQILHCQGWLRGLEDQLVDTGAQGQGQTPQYGDRWE